MCRIVMQRVENSYRKALAQIGLCRIQLWPIGQSWLARVGAWPELSSSLAIGHQPLFVCVAAQCNPSAECSALPGFWGYDQPPNLEAALASGQSEGFWFPKS